MIKIDNIRKSFPLNRQQRKELATDVDSIEIVKGVSFNCEPGKVTCLLGPNGAGKTTTLRVVGGILKADSGKIHIGGEDQSDSQGDFRSKIGLLTGHTKLYPRLTVEEMLQYFSDLYQVDRAAFRVRKEYLYDLLGIGAFANQRVEKLSTGMKQKASIARSIIHDPPIVIFDEPSSGLDVITAESIIALIRRCKEEGKTVLFSSHIMSEVDLLADDLILMHKGSVIYQNEMKHFRENMQSQSLTHEFIRRVQLAEN